MVDFLRKIDNLMEYIESVEDPHEAYGEFRTALEASTESADIAKAIAGLAALFDQFAEELRGEVAGLYPLLHKIARETVNTSVAPDQERADALDGIFGLYDVFFEERMFPAKEIPDTIELALRGVCNVTLSPETRQGATSFLCAVVGRSAKAIAKNEDLRNKLIEAGCDLTMVHDEKDTLKDEVGDRAYGMTILDHLHETVSPTPLISNRVLEIATMAIASEGAAQRKGGFLSMSIVFESMDKPGEGEAKTPKEFEFAPLLEHVLKGVDDPQPIVAASAWYALQIVGRNVDLPLVAQHARVVPLVLKTIEKEDQRPLVLYHCLNALAEFMETAVYTGSVGVVRGYLDALMKPLMKLLTAKDQDKDVMQGAFTAITDIAEAFADRVTPEDERKARRVVAGDAEEEEKKVLSPKKAAKPKKKSGSWGGDDESEEEEEAPKKDAPKPAEAKGPSAFQPYYDEIAPLLLGYLKQSDDIKMRAHATACLAGIVKAVGADTFKPLYPQVMALSVAGMGLGDAEFRAETFELFSALALVFGRDFMEQVPNITDALKEALDPMYTMKIIRADGEDEGDDEDDEDEDDEDDENRVMDVKLEEDKIEEQKNAVTLVANLCKHIGPDFYETYRSEFFKPMLQLLSPDFGMDQIKPLVIASCRYLPNIMPVQHKYTPGSAAPMDSSASRILSKVMPPLYEEFFNNEDPEVVSEVMGSLCRLVSWAGPVLYAKVLKKILVQIKKLLTFKAKCMEDNDYGEGCGENCGHDHDHDDEGDEDSDEDSDEDDEEQPGKGKGKKGGDDEEDEDEESDEEEPTFLEKAKDFEQLLQATLDLTSELAKSLGEKFAPPFKVLLPCILEHCEKGNPVRVLAMGTIADSIEAIGAAGAALLPSLMDPIIDGVKDTSDVGYRRNSSFALGVAFLKNGEKAFEYYDKAIEALKPVLSIDLGSEEHKKLDAEQQKDVAGLRDNATSALAKMLLVGASKLDLKEIVPLFLNALPLVDDFDEAQFVYSSVIKMANQFPKQYPGVVEPFLPKIASIFEQVVASDAPLRVEVKNFIETNLKTIKEKIAA